MEIALTDIENFPLPVDAKKLFTSKEGSKERNFIVNRGSSRPCDRNQCNGIDISGRKGSNKSIRRSVNKTR